LNILSGAESLVILSGNTGYYDLSVRPLRRGSYRGVLAFVAREPGTTYVPALILIFHYDLCYDMGVSVYFVHSLDFVFICAFCAFVFLTAYMLCYCQHRGVDLVGLKPGP